MRVLLVFRSSDTAVVSTVPAETSGLTLPPDQTRRNVMVPPFTPQNANGCHRNRALTPQALE